MAYSLSQSPIRITIQPAETTTFAYITETGEKIAKPPPLKGDKEGTDCDWPQIQFTLDDRSDYAVVEVYPVDVEDPSKQKHTLSPSTTSSSTPCSSERYFLKNGTYRQTLEPGVRTFDLKNVGIKRKTFTGQKDKEESKKGKLEVKDVVPATATEGERIFIPVNGIGSANKILKACEVVFKSCDTQHSWTASVPIYTNDIHQNTVIKLKVPTVRRNVAWVNGKLAVLLHVRYNGNESPPANFTIRQKYRTTAEAASQDGDGREVDGAPSRKKRRMLVAAPTTESQYDSGLPSYDSQKTESFSMPSLGSTGSVEPMQTEITAQQAQPEETETPQPSPQYPRSSQELSGMVGDRGTNYPPHTVTASQMKGVRSSQPTNIPRQMHAGTSTTDSGMGIPPQTQWPANQGTPTGYTTSTHAHPTAGHTPQRAVAGNISRHPPHNRMVGNSYRMPHTLNSGTGISQWQANHGNKTTTVHSNYTTPQQSSHRNLQPELPLPPSLEYDRRQGSSAANNTTSQAMNYSNTPQFSSQYRPSHSSNQMPAGNMSANNTMRMTAMAANPSANYQIRQQVNCDATFSQSSNQPVANYSTNQMANINHSVDSTTVIGPASHVSTPYRQHNITAPVAAPAQAADFGCQTAMFSPQHDGLSSQNNDLLSQLAASIDENSCGPVVDPNDVLPTSRLENPVTSFDQSELFCTTQNFLNQTSQHPLQQTPGSQPLPLSPQCSSSPKQSSGDQWSQPQQRKERYSSIQSVPSVPSVQSQPTPSPSTQDSTNPEEEFANLRNQQRCSSETELDSPLANFILDNEDLSLGSSRGSFNDAES